MSFFDKMTEWVPHTLVADFSFWPQVPQCPLNSPPDLPLHQKKLCSGDYLFGRVYVYVYVYVGWKYIVASSGVGAYSREFSFGCAFSGTINVT